MNNALLLALIGFLFFSGDAAPQTQHVFAIVPQFSAEKILERWQPVLDVVGKAAGLKLKAKTYRSITDFETAFLNGSPDFVYLNPYHAVMAMKAQGYQPFVRDGKLLVGILVVRSDSPVKQVRDLNGMNIGFPSPLAFGASLYIRAVLDKQEKISFHARYLNTHSNVYRHVLLGDVAAGGGILETLNQEGDSLRRELRVLYSTPGFPSHPVAAHPRVPASAVAAVQRAFIEAAAIPTVAARLQAIQFAHPRATDYKEYAALDRLGLERYTGSAPP